jgi:lysophospholipase L1-like esterase
MKSIENICVFGNSTAWGAWDKEKGGWVNRLWLYSAEKNPDLEIYNLSISGGTTKTINERFEGEASARKADALIFQAGGNDAAFDTDSSLSQIPLEEFERNVRAIIEAAKRMPPPHILFMGFHTCDETKTTPVSWCNLSYTRERIETYNKTMERVCNEMSVQFLDTFDLLENNDLEDGLHPNARGHEKIFKRVRNELVRLEWI